jgi:hypothetical protein
LRFVDSVYGWVLACYGDGTVIYYRSQRHFAPTHYAEIYIYDPRTGVDRKIYPVKPYEKERVEHIEKVRAAYERRGMQWFAKNNHHMDPELFNSSLSSKVAIHEKSRSLAFVIAFDNKEWWEDSPDRAEDSPEFARAVCFLRNVYVDRPISCKTRPLSDFEDRFGPFTFSKKRELPEVLAEILKEEIREAH